VHAVLRATGQLGERISDVSRRPSSRAARCVLPVGLPSASTSGASIGGTSLEPSLGHARCRCCDSTEPVAVVSGDAHFSAMRSAPERLAASRRSKYVLGWGDRSRGSPHRADSAHRLDAACQRRRDARADHRRREVRRLLRRAALAVDRCACDLERQSRRQPRGARDVEGLLADLAHAAADDLPDRERVDARPLEGRPLDRAQKLGRMHRRQPAVAAAERRTHRFDNDDVVVGESGHVSSLVVTDGPGRS
jgi:hypothetical protein